MNSENILFQCDLCDGDVCLAKSSDRYHEYKYGIHLPIPSDLELATCKDCKEIYLNTDDAILLEPIMKQRYKKYCKRFVDSILSTKQFSTLTIRQLSLALGCSFDYLKKAIDEESSEELSLTELRLLQCFEIYPNLLLSNILKLYRHN